MPHPLLDLADEAPHWFATDRVPTKDDLIARGFPRDGGAVTVHIEGGLSLDVVRSTLEAKGYVLGSDFGEVPSRALGPVAGEIVFNVSEPHFRAVTKIALNYFAASHGADLALRPEFDGARRFARFDEHQPHLAPCENPWYRDRRGHYASVTRFEEIIVVQLSVLMRIQYFVRLSSDGRDVPITPVAHLFDLDKNEIEQIEPLPIKRGRPLDVAK